MMKRSVLGALFTLCGMMAFSQSNDPVLMRVDGRPVTRSEFEAIYKKNNKDVSVTKEALDEYLELFINYKLKVRAAEALGMDTVAKFKEELAGYREQLARPYLVDRDLNEQLIQEAYDRTMKEVRASHILVQLPADPTPADTLAAYKRIVALRDRVMGGEDFEKVAKSKGGSDDPSAQKNGGDLGWFSALQMVYPFENAAYTTPVGEISQPVRTRFGYHIVKVVGQRQARGEVRVAHIMLRSRDTDEPEAQAGTERKIKEIHAKLVGGEISFEDAALRYSEDDGTSAKGGELPMFGTGKMVEEFEDACFALTKDGEISEPFRSRFGWHIAKRLEYKAPPTFDQAKGELKNKIGRDSRAEITKKAFLDKLKKEYRYTPTLANLKAVYPLVDTTIFKKGTVIMDTLLRKDVVEGPFMRNKAMYDREINGVIQDGKLVNIRSRKYEDMVPGPADTVVVREIQRGWSYDRKKAQKLKKPLFVLGDSTYTQQHFLDHLEAKQRRERVIPIQEYVDRQFDAFVDEMVMAYENGRLESKYPEFRMLMKEYRDGILLFELTDDMVWSKAVKDTAGLEAFYNANGEDFMWPTRYVADIYTAANAGVAKKMRALYKEGKRGQEIATALNKGSSLDLNVESGTWTAEEKPFLTGATKPGLTENKEVNGAVVVVDMKEVLPPGRKTLDEARGLVTAAYQDSLEKAWIKELRGKYPVVIDQEVLYSIK